MLERGERRVERWLQWLWLTGITLSERNSSDESANIIPALTLRMKTFQFYIWIALHCMYSSLNFSFCILCKFLLSLPNVINLSDFYLTSASPKCKFSIVQCSVLTENILIEQILAKWIGYFQVKIFSCFNVEKHFHPVLVGKVLWWKFNMSYYIW